MFRRAFFLLLCVAVSPAAFAAATVEGFSTSQQAQAAADAAQARVEREDKFIADQTEAIRQYMTKLYDGELTKPEYKDLDDRLYALRQELSELATSRKVEIQDLRAGLYCDGCWRTRSDLLAHGEPFPHPGQNAIQKPADPQRIAAKEAEFDRAEQSLKNQIANIEQQREARDAAFRKKLEDNKENLDRARDALWAAQERRYRARLDLISATYAASVLQRREQRAKEAAEAAVEKKKRDERREGAKKAAAAEAEAREQKKLQREAEEKAKAAEERAADARKRGDKQTESAALADRDTAQRAADRAAEKRERAQEVAADERHQNVRSGFNAPPADAAPTPFVTPDPGRRATSEVIADEISERFDAAKQALKEGGTGLIEKVRSGLEAAREFADMNKKDFLKDFVHDQLQAKQDKTWEEMTDYGSKTAQNHVTEFVEETLDDTLEAGNEGGKKSFFESARLGLVNNIKGKLGELSLDKIKETVIGRAHEIVYGEKPRLTEETNDAETNELGKRFEETIGQPNMVYESQSGTGGRAVEGTKSLLNNAVNNFFGWFERDHGLSEPPPP